MTEAIIRSYERADLPLSERLMSLARRFTCLDGADGISPFAPALLHRWVLTQPIDSAAHQTGLLLLNLADADIGERFDALRAARAWCPEDRQMFINLLRIWQF